MKRSTELVIWSVALLAIVGCVPQLFYGVLGMGGTVAVQGAIGVAMAVVAAGATRAYEREAIAEAHAKALEKERALYMAEALREVDALLPWTERVASPAISRASSAPTLPPFPWHERLICGRCHRPVDVGFVKHKAESDEVVIRVNCHGDLRLAVADARWFQSHPRGFVSCCTSRRMTAEDVGTGWLYPDWIPDRAGVPLVALA